MPRSLHAECCGEQCCSDFVFGLHDKWCAQVSSVVPISSLVFMINGAVRTKKHPVVVTGDTMLVVSAAEDGGRNKLVVVRLCDVGQSSMQMMMMSFICSCRNKKQPNTGGREAHEHSERTRRDHHCP